MSWEYLRYLARCGATAIHPCGRRATGILIDALHLQAGLRILEIGCGSGAALLQVALAAPVALWGVDVLPEMLRAAQLRIRCCGLRRRISLRQINAGEPLPFATGFFQRVYCESVLGFQEEGMLELLVQEMYRVLQPGGRCVLNEGIWKPGVTAAKASGINGSCRRDFGMPLASESPWDVSDWQRFFQKQGFRVVSAERLTDISVERSRGGRGVGCRLLSRLLSLLMRARAFSHPQLRRRRRRYQRLLRAHAADGQQIEARLFILVKPA